MRYQGGKHQASKHICPIMLEVARDVGATVYVEPFLGGASVASKMVPHFRVSLLSDTNGDIVEMWDRAANHGWRVDSYISKQEYEAIKASPGPSAIRGFAGLACTFCSKFMDHYIDGPENRQPPARAQLAAQGSAMTGAKISCSDYTAVELPPDSLVYLDPPYEGETAYRASRRFDHEKFWDWAWGLSGSSFVFVSSRTARPGWRCIWESSTNRGLRKAGESSQVERLFVREK